MRNIKVLVADDETTVRTFIKMVISKEHLPVSVLAEADNGTDAVSLTREYRPDLVFLDIRMPGMDGLRAAETILAGDFKPVVVIISAYNEFDYARTAFRAGVADFLLKPIKPGDVATIIKKVAEKCEDIGDADVTHKEMSATVVAAVAEYVAENLDAPIRLSDIARAVFVSPYHLSRTFKALTGESIMDYIQNQRLATASKILLTTDMPITEVAAKTGFSDAAYFATCFKNKTGITPLQYRKKQDIENK